LNKNNVSPDRDAEKKKLTSPRPSLRERGIKIGIFEPGPYNAITDVKGVKVGHVTYIEDNVDLPDISHNTCIRTGVTAVLPGGGDTYERHMVAGGFVLNGIGEMSGLTQVLEWGWIESPIMLTNTMSVGPVSRGVVNYMLKNSKKLREKPQVVIPVVGETDDSFLNDVRVNKIVPDDVTKAIKNATGGPVIQGSIGAGTGMTTCDFAGGIGTSSRILPGEEGGYTIGVLVLSNFGLMRNLTIEGAVVGRELDKIFPQEGRKNYSYGSIIVILGTDAPLLSSQLNRLSIRAALGLGRVGSHARSTSGEIIIAFSTRNRVYREEYGKSHYLTMKYISDNKINSFYEAVIETTEEAVLNSIFCSNGMTGYNGNFCPPIPHDKVLEILYATKKR